LLREAVVWSVAGGVLWAGLSILTADALWGLGWWVLVSAMLLTHLGMVDGEDGSRRESLGTPNALTLARAWAVPALPLLIDVPWAFAVVVAAATVTDVLDGYLARAGADTRLGAHMDHGVDTAFTITAALTAAAAGWIPWWLAWIVVARYAAPIVGLAAIYFWTATQPPRDAFARGRVPGGLLLLGLVLVAIDDTRQVGAVLIMAGALLGVAALATSAARSVRVAR
jgi:phosphatidylglycerophosphate synthase